VGAAAVLSQATEDGAHELACVLPVTALLRGEANAQGLGQPLDVFNPRFEQAVGIQFHSRAL
jgi:hypothetical protein